MTIPARYAHPEAIVNTAWLAEHLRDPALRVFDCTTYLRYETGTGRPYRVESGRADYDAGHIPGSAFLDLQGSCPNLEPVQLHDAGPRIWRRASRRRGSARAHASSSIPVEHAMGDAGLVDAAGGRLRRGGGPGRRLRQMGRRGPTDETTETCYPSARLMAGRARGCSSARRRCKAAIGDAGACTINALAPDLHRGENPRYGRPGRIPGSVNMPAAALVDPDALTFKPRRGGGGGLCRRRRGTVEAILSIAAAASRRRSMPSCCTSSAIRMSPSTTPR